jgi:hypothetical protein
VWAQALLAVARDTAREIRKNSLAYLLAAFFFGYGAAAILSTVKLLPGLQLLDQIMVGLAAGWIVGRSGGLPSVATFTALVLAMSSSIVHVPVMALLDHFRGAWRTARPRCRTRSSSRQAALE